MYQCLYNSQGHIYQQYILLPPNSAHNQVRQAIDKNGNSALLIPTLLNSGIDDGN